MDRGASKFEFLRHPISWGVAVTALLVGTYVYLAFQEDCDDDGCTTKWVQFIRATPNEIGDTLAGLAGSLAFLWIIVTVFLQSRELKEQRLEFEQMNSTMSSQLFENTFFEVVSTLNEIVNSIDLHNARNQTETRGRDCFNVFYNRLRREFQKTNGRTPEALELAYAGFWLENQIELGHYFRFLYRAFLLIDESPHSKKYHAKLLRSQLSNQELLLIFYNCLSENGDRFLRLAEKFELFDNLPIEMLLEKEHAQLVNVRCFGQNKALSEKKKAD